jgi:uncharacterized membrane protein
MRISRWNLVLVLAAVALTIITLVLSLITSKYPVSENDVSSFSVLGIVLCLVIVFIRSRYEWRKKGEETE